MWALRKILALDIAVQPMHPDGAAGLRPVGRLSIAVNYFLALILMFFTLMLVFDPFSREQPLYVVLCAVFYLLAPVLMVLSLSRANKTMTAKKEAEIARLQLTFKHYYSELSKGSRTEIYSIKNADGIASVYRLYEIVDRMPVWPFDIRNTARFVTSILIPLIIFLWGQISDPSTVIKLRDWFVAAVN